MHAVWIVGLIWCMHCTKNCDSSRELSVCSHLTNHSNFVKTGLKVLEAINLWFHHCSPDYPLTGKNQLSGWKKACYSQLLYLNGKALNQVKTFKYLRVNFSWPHMVYSHQHYLWQSSQNIGTAIYRHFNANCNSDSLWNYVVRTHLEYIRYPCSVGHTHSIARDIYQI